MPTFVCERCRLVLRTQEASMKHSLGCNSDMPKVSGKTVWEKSTGGDIAVPPLVKMGDDA